MQPDATIFTGISLCKKAAILGIVVFRLTWLAHVECLHGRIWTIIGHASQDGIAGPANGASGKGIAIPSIGWVVYFALTFWTKRHIGRQQQNRQPFVVTFLDGKIVKERFVSGVRELLVIRAISGAFFRIYA